MASAKLCRAATRAQKADEQEARTNTARRAAGGTRRKTVHSATLALACARRGQLSGRGALRRGIRHVDGRGEGAVGEAWACSPRQRRPGAALNFQSRRFPVYRKGEKLGGTRPHHGRAGWRGTPARRGRRAGWLRLQPRRPRPRRGHRRCAAGAQRAACSSPKRRFSRAMEWAFSAVGGWVQGQGRASAVRDFAGCAARANAELLAWGTRHPSARRLSKSNSPTAHLGRAGRPGPGCWPC